MYKRLASGFLCISILTLSFSQFAGCGSANNGVTQLPPLDQGVPAGELDLSPPTDMTPVDVAPEKQ